MKNYKRAIRRAKGKAKFEKRLKLWIPPNKVERWIDLKTGIISFQNWQEAREDAQAGKSRTFLKWSSTPCSCSMCQPEKYKRPSKGKVKKLIEENVL